MTQRIAVTYNGIVRNVEEIYIAKDGVIEFIPAAALACGGLAHTVWPKNTDGPDSNIFWTNELLVVSDSVVTPDVCDTAITFLAETGKYFYDLIDDQGEGTYLNPPVDGLGQYLIRCDPTAGSILGNATGVWIDLFSLGPTGVFAWFISQASVGESTGEADISIAKDAGGGVPEASTIVVKHIIFFAEVLQGFLTLTSNPWNLESIVVDEDAVTEVEFLTNRTMNGYGVTSGDFVEQYASSGDPSLYTVEATQISGDPMNGTFDTPLNLGETQNWTLVADDDGENFSAQVQFTVSIDTEEAVKQVFFRSHREDVSDPNLVWPETGVSVVDQAVTSNGPASCTIEMANNGFGIGQALINGNQFTDPWHADAPSVTNAGNYEVKLEIDAFSDDPSVGSSAVGVWLNLAIDRSWEWDSPSQGLVPYLFANCTVTVRAIGLVSSEEARPIAVIVNPQNAP